MMNTLSTLNAIAGKVLGEEFVGAAIRVYVETDDQREVKVLVPDAEYRAGEIRSGGRVELAWDTPSAYVLPAG